MQQQVPCLPWLLLSVDRTLRTKTALHRVPLIEGGESCHLLQYIQEIPRNFSVRVLVLPLSPLLFEDLLFLRARVDPCIKGREVS
jgi:hypothetical protein